MDGPGFEGDSPEGNPQGRSSTKAWTFQAKGLFTVWPFNPDLDFLNRLRSQVWSIKLDFVLYIADNNLAVEKYTIASIENTYKHFITLAGFGDISNTYSADGIVIRFKDPTQYLDAIKITVEGAVNASLDRATIDIQGSGGAVCGGQNDGQNGQNCQFP